ncbi:MAG: oxidoreductase, partial [Bacteroidales bacterium]|nr:oxidoreductase [Bacteroidales bacterium]
MGEAAVRALAREGRSVVMACRNPEKADAVRSRILADLPGSDISIGRLDLASLDSVRAFVDG